MELKRGRDQIRFQSSLSSRFHRNWSLFIHYPQPHSILLNPFPANQIKITDLIDSSSWLFRTSLLFNFHCLFPSESQILSLSMPFPLFFSSLLALFSQPIKFDWNSWRFLSFHSPFPTSLLINQSEFSFFFLLVYSFILSFLRSIYLCLFFYSFFSYL